MRIFVLTIVALFLFASQGRADALKTTEGGVTRWQTTSPDDYSDAEASNISIMAQVVCSKYGELLCADPIAKSFVSISTYVLQKGYTKFYRIQHEYGQYRMTVAR